jgi:putative chitinase
MTGLADLFARLFRRNDQEAAVAAATAVFMQPLQDKSAVPLVPRAEPGQPAPVVTAQIVDAHSDQQPVPASTDPASTDPASSNQMSDFPAVAPPPAIAEAPPPSAPLAGLEAAIRACAPRLTDAEVATWVDALTEPLRRNRIDTPRRIAAFLGQCAHESGGFKVMQENLNYRAERLCQVWPARFPNLATANECARNPERLANRVYANRMGNGDEASGDGWRFRGRGLIQLTGRSNYQRFASSLGCTVEDAAQQAETPRGAGESAAFFWSANSLNALADAWSIDAMTRKINGGTAGAVERRHLCDTALAAIGE